MVNVEMSYLHGHEPARHVEDREQDLQDHLERRQRDGHAA